MSVVILYPDIQMMMNLICKLSAEESPQGCILGLERFVLCMS